MTNCYSFHDQVIRHETDDNEINIIPYQPDMFEKVIKEYFSMQDVNVNIVEYEGDATDYNYGDEEFTWDECDYANQFEKNIVVGLYENSPYWDILFNSIRNVNRIRIGITRSPPNYDWLEHVKSVEMLSPDCPPELFDLNKLTETVYQPWMDIEKRSDIVYVIDKHLTPKLRKVVITNLGCIEEHIFEQLSNFEYLEKLYIYTFKNLDYGKYFGNIECDKLYFQNNYIDSIIALNKHKCIYSTYECSKEVVDANYTLIDGSLLIKGMDEHQSKDYLENIFTRNRRAVKSAR